MPAPSTFLPTHRLLITALAAAFFALVAWACLANIDVVVNAQGKLVPASFVRVAQPAEDGVVRAVLVKDGQTVTAGQPLVEMDPLYATEDVRSAESQGERLRLQQARIDAELTGRAFAPTEGSEAQRAAAVAEYTTLGR